MSRTHITDNTKSIIAKVQGNIQLTLRLMVEDVHRISLPKTPYRTGDLRTRVSKTVVGNSAIIEWLVPYAVYQENKQYYNYTTAGTGPHFAENSVFQVVGNVQKYNTMGGLI